MKRMRILTRETCPVAVHVHEDFTGDAIIVVAGDEGPPRYAEVPVRLLMRGDFEVSVDCLLTDRELRMATSIVLDGYLTAYAGAGVLALGAA